MYQPSEKFISQLQRHEGFYPAPYLCPAGVVTIGYGTNLEAHPQYIPFEGIRAQVIAGKLSGANLLQALQMQEWQWRKKDGAAAMLEEVAACHDSLMNRCDAYRWLREYSDLPAYDVAENSWHVRADALLNMAFNLGVDGLLGFVNTLRYVRGGNYELAADNMLASKWARQVKGRAVELAAQMKTGRFKE
jgi:lysozyme